MPAANEEVTPVGIDCCVILRTEPEPVDEVFTAVDALVMVKVSAVGLTTWSTPVS